MVESIGQWAIDNLILNPLVVGWAVSIAVILGVVKLTCTMYTILRIWWSDRRRW